MTALDELFMTDGQRKEVKLPRIYNLPIAEIDDFPEHPFDVKDDEDMAMLRDNIKERGVITPATVRKKDDGRYELISGHRRKYACQSIGLETLRCEIADVSHEEAVILMVDSNLQRTQLSPMEKARAYKMRLEALNHQGKPALSPTGTKSERSTDAITDESGDSKNQIYRYIRLNYLVPELQDFVNTGKMKMRPAVELSYLDEESQRDVVDRIDETESFPSHDQAIRMRKAFEEHILDYDTVSDIMNERKPNQKPTIKLKFEDFGSFFKQSDSYEKIRRDITEGLQLLQRKRQKDRANAR